MKLDACAAGAIIAASALLFAAPGKRIRPVVNVPRSSGGAMTFLTRAFIACALLLTNRRAGRSADRASARVAQAAMSACTLALVGACLMLLTACTAQDMTTIGAGLSGFSQGAQGAYPVWQHPGPAPACQMLTIQTPTGLRVCSICGSSAVCY